jgi:hypothetical protein
MPKSLVTLESLHDWLKVCEQRVQGPLAITLRQFDGDQNEVVEEIGWSESEGSLMALGQGILERAKQDADSLGCETYTLHCKGVAARFGMRFSLEEENDDTKHPVDGYEPAQEEFQKPTLKMAIGMQMDHNHKLVVQNSELVKQIVGQCKDSVQMIWKMAHEDHETMRNLQKQQVGVINAYTELREDKHRREIEVRQFEKKEERKDKFIEALGPIGRGMAAKMMGPGQGPQGPHPIVLQMVKLFSTLTREQWEAMIAPLNDEQKLEIMNLVAALQDQQGGGGQGSPPPPPPSPPPPPPSPPSEGVGQEHPQAAE